MKDEAVRNLIEVAKLARKFLSEEGEKFPPCNKEGLVKALNEALVMVELSKVASTETKEAIDELEQGYGKSFTTVESLMDDLNRSGGFKRDEMIVYTSEVFKVNAGGVFTNLGNVDANDLFVKEVRARVGDGNYITQKVNVPLDFDFKRINEDGQKEYVLDRRVFIKLEDEIEREVAIYAEALCTKVGLLVRCNTYVRETKANWRYGQYSVSEDMMQGIELAFHKTRY